MTTSMTKTIHLAGGCFRGMDDEAILKMEMAVPKGMTVEEWLKTMPGDWRQNLLLGTRECLKRGWPLNGADIQRLTAQNLSK